MPEPQLTTRAKLLADIDFAWNMLNTTLDRLTDVQMTTPQDAQGWTVKDHLIHLAHWERSVVFFLEGKARHQGLGVDEALYLKGDEDAINAEIQQQNKDLPLIEARTLFHNIHQQLVKALEPLTDADLQKPYRTFLPEEPGEGDGPPALNVIYGNSANHYTLHMPWMMSIGEGS